MNKQSKSIKMCNKVIEFIKKNGRHPSVTKAGESAYARFISNVKQAKQTKGTLLWDDSLQQLATDAGYPDMFELKNIEQKQYDMTVKLVEWVNDNKKTPSTRASDASEKKLGYFLVSLKRGNANLGRWKLYDATREYIKNSQYPNLLDIRGR